MQDEFKDESPVPTTSEAKPESLLSDKAENDKTADKLEKQEPNFVNLIDDLENTSLDAGICSDLAGLRMDSDMPANFGSFMPSQLLQVSFFNLLISHKN